MTRPGPTIALGALALVAACARAESAPSNGGFSPSCSMSGPSMPAVHIGPDATIRVGCGGLGTAAVASVDERGAGVTSWSASVQGSPPDHFTLIESRFVTCQVNGPSVASVRFQAPVGSLPGDNYEGLVTVHADDGSFADGTVQVHGVVVAPSVTVDKTTIDFGDLAPGASATQRLTFMPDVATGINPSKHVDPPFSLLVAQSSTRLTALLITFSSPVPGDFSASVEFTTSVVASLPAACKWTTTIALHAHVVGDAGTDGGAD